MAKRKLKSFSADDAGDSFTPSVKTLKAGDLPESESSETKQKKSKVVDKPKKTTAKKSPPPAAKKPSPKQPEAVEPVPQAKAVPSPPPAPPKKEEKSAKPAFEKTRKVKPSSDEERVEAQVQLVGFCVGAEEFGVDIQEVQEINRTLEITPVPRTPKYMKGVVNLRGKVIPVIDMRIRFGLEETETTGNTRIVIVEVGNKIIGMLVDSVSEVLRISSSVIEPPPDIVSNVESEYIRAVAKLENRLVILLDLNKMMMNLELKQQSDLKSTVS